MPPQDTDQTRWFVDEVHALDGHLRVYLRGTYPAVRDVDDVVQEFVFASAGARWYEGAGDPQLLIREPQSWAFSSTFEFLIGAAGTALSFRHVSRSAQTSMAFR